MAPRIAIPEPISTRAEYNQRSLPQYVQAVEQAGGEAVVVPLSATPEEAARIAINCDAALLPGSPADVDPAQYGVERDPRSAPADPQRDAIDAAILREAYAAKKPVLGICYGMQSLNVWRGGTLVQHIESPVNHEAGKAVLRAHKITVEPASRLARLLGLNGSAAIDVNSSHHQSAEQPGRDLSIVARSPQDGVVEAVEGSDPEHFVLGVQWHPERTTGTEETSRALFRAFIAAAEEKLRPTHVEKIQRNVIPSAPADGESR